MSYKMKLIFTRHALERIKQRGIMLREVVVCLDSPDKIDHKNGTRFMKLIGENRILILACTIKNESCKIRTAYITSQTKKYL